MGIEDRIKGLERYKDYASKVEGIAAEAVPTHFTVMIPAGCEQYANDIRRFIDAMVYKLEKNAHKGRWEDLSVSDALGLLHKEVEELQAEIGGNTMKIVMEAADVANFAMIVASIAIERNR